MSVEVQNKPKWPGKVGTLFGKSRSAHKRSVGGKIEHAVLSEEVHHQEGVRGAGQLEERNPIQNVTGTGFSVNQPQQPTSEEINNEEGKRVNSEERQGEGSQAVSLRRNSDEEIRAADEDDIKEEAEEKENISRIEFYRKDEPYFWLSNSSDHPVYLDGAKYPTAEHLFQATKFLPHRPDLATKIRKISSPNDAIKEARKNIADVKRGWIGKGGNVASMRDVLLLKFTQHSVLRRQLLLTGDAELVETSPVDAFWGNAAGFDGGFGGGRNELGKALSKTRENIRAQAGLGIGSAAKTV